MPRLCLVTLLMLNLAGCSEPKPPPIDPALAVDSDPAGEPARPPLATERPAVSDAESLALVNAALDAHTKGDRAQVRKLRIVDYTRQGVGQGLEENPLGLIWAFNCAWPLRTRVRAEFPGPKVLTFVVSGNSAWRRVDSGPVMTLSGPEARDLQIDISGEWVWLLFPFLDADAAFAPAAALASDPSLKGVQFFHPQLAPCSVYFHPQTKLLTRIFYEGRESGQSGLKEFQVIEHAPFAGVTLPKRLAQTFLGKQYADWVMTKLEPRNSVDESLFRAE